MAAKKVKEIPVQDIQINRQDVLGRGGYGQVFSGVYAGRKIAVKLLIDRGLVPNGDKEDMIREANRLVELSDHPRIIDFYGVLMEENNYGLVIEYMHLGNSFSFVTKYDVKPPLLLRITMDVASAMKYLHSFDPPMLHKDLKADNILINNHFIAKVCDFGLSKWKTVTENATGDKPSVGPRGTITHIAPEVLRNINCKFTKEIDVYAFAITVWELFAGRIPYKSMNEALIWTLVCEKQRPDLSCLCENCPEVIPLMLKSCWHDDVAKRQPFHVIFKEVKKAYEEHEHEINGIIKSLQEQINPNLTEADPETDTETDLLSMWEVRPGEPLVLSPLKPVGEHPSELKDRTTLNSNIQKEMENLHLKDLSVEGSSSIQTSESKDSINPETEGSKISNKVDCKTGTITGDSTKNQHVGDQHLQQNEDMTDRVTEQNNGDGQNRKEMEQKTNSDHGGVRYKMADFLPTPSVVDLKTSADNLPDLGGLLDSGSDRLFQPKQTNSGQTKSSLEVDEFSKQGTLGPEPPEQSHADPLQPRSRIPPSSPASNIQPPPRPSNITSMPNTAQKPPSESESIHHRPHKYPSQASGGGTPPPNQTPPRGGATGMGIPTGQPGRLTISHQHSGGGFTHISMDQNSQNQPNVQVGDSNVMVIGRSRYSDSDDEWKGQQISKKKSLKLPDTPVTMDDLDIVCVDIGKDWKRLSRGMGLDESRIDQIQQDYHISGQYELMYQSLRVWKNKTGKAATVRALGKCLSNIDRDDLIKKLKELDRN